MMALFQDDLPVNFVSPLHGNTGALDALLGSYAAGSLSVPLHALVASHLAIKADNRGFVNSMEHLAADVAFDAMPGSLSDLDRSRRLDAVFCLDAAPDDEPESGFLFVPAPLAAYLGKPYESLEWRSVMPGLKQVEFEAAPGCEAQMLWIKAGRTMPSHTHPGMEATLVLKGSFSDVMGHYSRGDLAVVDSDTDHKPVAGQDEDCICFAVSEGPVRLTGAFARLFQKLLRH
jgi:putative transcriptional regulator